MDELISSDVVAGLRDALREAAPKMPFSSLAQATSMVSGKRLRDRVDLVRDALLADIPPGFPAAQTIIQDALAVPAFTGWMIWPVSEVATARAVESGSTADFDGAMDLLAQLTVGLTGEFAVRELLNARPERAIDTMRSWAAHDDEHVRRLASEGSRAYLPWAKRVPSLIAHPEATRGIIDALYRDRSEYVRRSVANHLNDLSRVAPALVADIARGWSAQPDANTPRILRHGLRTLIKKADSEALALLGFTGGSLRVERPHLSASTIPPGGALEFSAVVTNDGTTDATAAIDYTIGFVRANGAVTPKTFKITSRRLGAGESVSVRKRHLFHPITTRTYYPGEHYVTVQANGTLSPRADFTLQGTVVTRRSSP